MTDRTIRMVRLGLLLGSASVSFLALAAAIRLISAVV